MITGLAALGTLVVVVASTSTGARTLVGVQAQVQSVISIAVPFFGVLLINDCRATRRPRPVDNASLPASALAAGIVAMAWGLVGAVLSVVGTAIAAATEDRWQHAVSVIVGGVVVQVSAQLVGIGFGLLISRPILAMAATVVLPLAAYLLLGGGLPAWLTPFASAQRLLSGAQTATGWGQTAVMLLIWGGALNVIGLAVFTARRRADHAGRR